MTQTDRYTNAFQWQVCTVASAHKRGNNARRTLLRKC